MMTFEWLAGLIGAIAAIVMAAYTPLVPATTSGADAGMHVDALRRGGYVIFFRHATADQGSDATPFDLADCARQRNLGEKGIAEAEAIGAAFRDLQIPVGAVLSSEFCRARDTARLAFGETEPAPGLNLCCEDGTGQSPETREAFLLGALTTRPRLGTNTILVGHGAFMMADLAMGEAAVYRPDGSGGFTRVARVRPDEWQHGVYRSGAATPDAPTLAPVR